MWLLVISVCSAVQAPCSNFVATGEKFNTFHQCVTVGHAALQEKESAARIADYRCVKVR